MNTKTTSTKTGLWIDHRQAIIVSVIGNLTETQWIESHVETQPRRASGSPLKDTYDAQELLADDSRQRAMTGHLNAYYDAVIAHLCNAESILIFGSGEAKGELCKRLQYDDLGARVIMIETADKMSDCQLAAKVREYFCTEKLYEEAMQVTNSIRLKILGMSAGDGNVSVCQALQSVPQVKNVVVDEISGTAWVWHGGVSSDALVEAVHQVGYGVYTL